VVVKCYVFSVKNHSVETVLIMFAFTYLSVDVKSVPRAILSHSINLDKMLRSEIIEDVQNRFRCRCCFSNR
jgi:predicted class III extradiol MEMO1 family dioxygenase